MSSGHLLGIFPITILVDLNGILSLLPSSFYGLLDLLSGTELNPGQSEIGKKDCTYDRRTNNLIHSPNR